MHVLYTHASHPPMSARTHTLLHLMHLCTHTRPCFFAQSMVYVRVAIDVLAPMCWMHLCTEYGRCSRCHRCASTYVLACDFWRLRARPCFCALTHRHACMLGHAFARSPTDMRACANACARVPMRVLGPMSWHASNARTHTADVLADFCDGDVAPRSRKRPRRLPHAHVCQVVSHITSDMPRASQPEALTARSAS